MLVMSILVFLQKLFIRLIASMGEVIETQSVKKVITEITEGGKDAFGLRGREYQLID